MNIGSSNTFSKKKACKFVSSTDDQRLMSPVANFYISTPIQFLCKVFNSVMHALNYISIAHSYLSVHLGLRPRSNFKAAYRDNVE